MPPAELPPEPSRRDRRQRRTGGSEQLVCLPLKTITPIFGGAARPRHLDNDDPIRVPGIRGQLRFFWRALYGHNYGRPDELAAREAALWGAVTAQGPVRSRVDLSVTVVDRGSHDTTPIRPNSLPGYVLWPAGTGKKTNNKEGEDPAPRRNPGVRFVLHVRIAAKGSADETEVLVALRAWLLFGGIGSRTRRGCGSLTLDGEAKRVIEPGIRLPARATREAVEATLGLPCFGKPAPILHEMPSFHGAHLFFGEGSMFDGEDAWHAAIEQLKLFRKDSRPDKRDRRREDVHQHADRIKPLASLGLPIVGLAGDDKARLAWCDKFDSDHDRLASPLIIKPLPLASGEFVPVALWLHRKDPEGSLFWWKGEQRGDKVADEFPPSSGLLNRFDFRRRKKGNRGAGGPPPVRNVRDSQTASKTGGSRPSGKPGGSASFQNKPRFQSQASQDRKHDRPGSRKKDGRNRK